VDPNHEETMFDPGMDATVKDEAEIEKMNSINTIEIDNAINIMNDPVALARAAKV
jgi:hypothetical protein